MAFACQTKRTTVGGVVVVMKLDGNLQPSDLSALTIEVAAPANAGRLHYQHRFPIPQELASFPASIAIESNGSPTASATIRLTLSGPSEDVDARQYELDDIPVDATTEFDVVFSRACAPSVSSCGVGLACCPLPDGSAGCSPSTVVVSAQHAEPMCTGPDGGGGADAAGDAPIEATPEASLDAGDSTVALDANGGDGEAAAGDDAPIGYEGGTGCNSTCQEGVTHCVANGCVAVPPSCAGGGPGADFHCGGYFGTDDCCATLDVPLTPQDQFFRDHDNNTFLDESHPATVSRFRLDVYEVTVGRFRKFVSAVVGADGGSPWQPAARMGRHTHLAGGQGLNAGGSSTNVYEQGWDPAWNANLPTTKAGWDAELTGPCDSSAGPIYTWTPDPDPQNPNQEILPISCVDWYAAYAFCIWDGGFLPSTTEWDFAAAGGRTQRVYAWGDNPPQNNSDYAIDNCIFHKTPTGNCWNLNNPLGASNIAPVGYATKGRALWGQMDMTGSVFEWTLDFYDGTYPIPCVDCANFSNVAASRSVRGGGFDSPIPSLAVSEAFYHTPTQPPADNGVRCARLPY
jgi:formylglycine-generating enzyme required for sulfatase activity